MAEVVLDTQDLLIRAMRGYCTRISRNFKRLWNQAKGPRYVRYQMEESDQNFYSKFLRWLYSIEASTVPGSRLFVADILARFPLSDTERRKLSLSEFLENLSRLFGEIIALGVAGKRGPLKVKILEGQLLFEQMAMNL